MNSNDVFTVVFEDTNGETLEEIQIKIVKPMNHILQFTHDGKIIDCGETIHRRE